MNDRDYELDESELLGSEAQESDPELDEQELDDREQESDDRELELAAELLEVSDEQELDQFLGKAFRRLGGAARGLLASPAGQQLKAMLRGAARKALPAAGRAIGGYFGGAAGGDAGANLAAQAGQLFGLELEGLSGEDQELEVARRFVRFSSEAIQQLARTPGRGSNPRKAAAYAMAASARRHAPGMLSRRRSRGPSASAIPPRPRSSGRWVRRKGKIVLLDL